MTRKWLHNVLGFSIAVLLILPIGAFAQITITSGDILGLIGKSQILEDDTSGNDIAVNVGAAGQNRTWDFRSVILQSDKWTNQFVAPSGTPFAAKVPQSNFVQKTTIASDPSSSFYLYYQVASNNLRTLGGGVVSPDTTFFGFLGTQNLGPLPLQFGMTWVSVETDTFGDAQTFAIISTSTSNNSVDASGQVRLPSGDFDCLRIRDNNVTVSTTIFNGIPLPPDTSRTIDYRWISKADFLVAAVTSQDGETNPSYTTATSFVRIFSKTTSVASPRANEHVPMDFGLSQNFPNPFGNGATSRLAGNSTTEISFQLARAERTDLSIYNITGEKVRTLVSGTVQPGHHSVKWDGTDENGKRLASGTYVYRLKVGNLQQARKMILLQ